MKKCAKRFFLSFTMSLLSLCIVSFPSFAETVCSQSQTIPDVPLFFYSNSLGSYTINLTNTLSAIATGQADNNGDSNPYYEKNWTGNCPGGLTGDDDSCHEYTVYPDDTNFTPGDIMTKIEKYTNGEPNRGEVRVLTDASETHYVYTTDHEKTFCGPYPIPGSQSQKK